MFLGHYHHTPLKLNLNFSFKIGFPLWILITHFDSIMYRKKTFTMKKNYTLFLCFDILFFGDIQIIPQLQKKKFLRQITCSFFESLWFSKFIQFWSLISANGRKSSENFLLLFKFNFILFQF